MVRQTFRGAVVDALDVEELRKGLTIRQTLINLHLTPKGGNYKRVYEIQERFSGEIGLRAPLKMEST